MRLNKFCSALMAVVALALVATSATTIAQTVTARSETNTVVAGQSAGVFVNAPAGTTVTIVATGPAPLPPPVTVVGTGRETRVSIGPFAQSGDYVIVASGGGQTARVNMRVGFPPAETPPGPGGNAGQAYQQAASPCSCTGTASRCLACRRNR